MKRVILIAVAACFALCPACTWSSETSFFSSFSVRQLVQRNESSAGLTCDLGGGGGISSSAGGVGSGGTHFSSHKSDTCACRITNGAFDEARLFSALKLDVERALHDAGVQITDRGSSGDASFYFAYALKNVRGRVQLTGIRGGTDYYDVRADLDESGS